MAKCKTPPTTPGEQIAQQILNNYDIKSAEDVQDVLIFVYPSMGHKVDSCNTDLHKLFYTPQYGA